MFLPGIECDIKKSNNNDSVIHMCVIFNDSILEKDLINIAEKYNSYLIDNGDNYILIEQLFYVLDDIKVILYPYGTKQKGIRL